MISIINNPPLTPPPLELHVHYIVIRADGYSKRFNFLGQKRSDDGPWTQNGHHPSSGEVLIPVDPWTAVKTNMCSFDELQLSEGARALLNIIK